MKRSAARILPIVLLMSSPGACQTGAPELERVQRAVATRAQGALAQAPTPSPGAIPEAAQPAREGAAVDALPTVANEGGEVRFVPDASHREIAVARFAGRLAVAWTDEAHDGIWFGLADAAGTALGRGQRVHAVVEDEERAGAPAVVATDAGFAVAWVDDDNGRVLFARLDASRRLLGAPSIVHDGLDRPRGISLAWSGHDYGVGVSLWQGVFFTHLDAQGARRGDGAMMSEGEAVTALDAVRWERDGYVLSWTESRDGREERVLRRVDLRGGRGVVGLNPAPRRVL